MVRENVSCVFISCKFIREQKFLLHAYVKSTFSRDKATISDKKIHEVSQR